MKILITGSTGLLGQALSRQFAPACDVTGVSRHAPGSPLPTDQELVQGSVRGGEALSQGGRPSGSPVRGTRHVVCDLSDWRRTREVLHACRPEVVIHTQALSDVDRCEGDPRLSETMNVTTTGHVVKAAQEIGAWLVYISTDYVFDGTKGRPYDERDVPNPLSVYGKSKLEGERVALGYARGVVVRPSTLFGMGRTNFCDQIVTRVKAGRTVEAFQDQVTSPTYTVDLAEGLDTLARAMQRQPVGTARSARVFHMANAGGCSRLEFAHRVVDLLGCSREAIRAIQIAEQHRPAPRPAYSALTTHNQAHGMGRTLRPWDEALEAYLREHQ